jgi:hypothetical protein
VKGDSLRSAASNQDGAGTAIFAFVSAGHYLERGMSRRPRVEDQGETTFAFRIRSAMPLKACPNSLPRRDAKTLATATTSLASSCFLARLPKRNLLLADTSEITETTARASARQRGATLAAILKN